MRSQSNKPVSRRRWGQFSLRSLFAMVAVFPLLWAAYYALYPPFLPVRSDPAMYSLPHYHLAKRLAADHLKTHKADWGVPMSMSHRNWQGKSVYSVVFATPREEFYILGYRTIIVDVETESAEFTPRD